MNEHVAPFDAETKALEAPFAHESETRLWLRLLTCANLIEGRIRSELRTEFDVTLPRFDLMAQLDRAKEGMTLSELSQRMMVTNGNVTHLVEKLMVSGEVKRETAAHDRRVQIVQLTPQGRAEFRRMASAHADWLAEMFAGLSPAETTELMRLLAKIKASVRASEQGEKP